ncbi:MAG TPA: ABC transporter permease [Gaiellaceae bacterium]|nr:ABC transporter permease [Gaiellaceae bacterium]
MASMPHTGADPVASALAAPPLEATRLPELPEIVVEGGPGRVSRAGLRELWDFRELVTAFAARQVLVKYKQAFVGLGWSVVQPVASAIIFSIFLGRFAHLGGEGLPYVLFVLAGMTSWTFFSGALGNSMESCVRDAVLLRKVFFPREILPLAAVLASLVDFAPTLLTLVVVSAVKGIYPAWTLLAVPLPLVILVATALALGLAASALNVYYRDVRYVLPFLVQIGLFATPVVFSLSLVPPRWRLAYQTLNPVATAIDDMRRAVVHHTWPAPLPNALALVWVLVLLVLGYLLFKRLERGFADRV